MTRLRPLKYLALLLAVFALALAGWWFGPARQGEAVVEAVLSGVEKHLAVDVQVGEVTASFWQHFPSVGVQLESVEIEDALHPGTSFLEVEKVEVRFNLLDILRGQYAVDRVVIHGGRVDLMSGVGGNNWHFWKDGGTGESAFDLALPDVRLEDIALSGNFKSSGAPTTRFSASVDLATARLAYLAGSWVIGGHLQGKSVEMFHGDQSYMDYATLTTDFELDWLGSTRTADLRFDAEANKVDVSGELQYSGGDFSLHLQGKQANLEVVRTALPLFIQTPIKDLVWTGRSDFDVVIGGEPAWTVELQPLGVHLALAGLSIDGLRGELRLEPADEMIRVGFEHLKADVAGGALSADGYWLGSSHGGVLEASTAWSGRSTGLAAWLERAGSPRPELDFIDGQLAWAGDLKGPTTASASISEWTIEGAVEATDVQASSSLSPIQSIESARVEITATGLSAKLRAHTSGGALTASAQSPPGLSAWSVQLTAADLDLSAIQTAFNSQASSALSAPSASYRPELRFEVDVQTARHGALTLEQAHVGGQLSSTGVVKIEDFKAQTCGGLILGSAEWNAPQWSVQAQASSLDLQELLASTNGLGQTVVHADNVYGTAALNGTASWDATRPEGEALAADFTLTVLHGGLKNFALLARIPAAIRDQPGMRALADADDLQRRLQHVRFGELTNRFKVSDGGISFPPVHIISDALDIGIGGRYDLDGGLAYTVDFALRDLRDQRSEFGEIEDDGLGHRFFLGIGGTVEEPEFWYDRSAHNAFRKARRRGVLPEILAPTNDPISPAVVPAVELADPQSAGQVSGQPNLSVPILPQAAAEPATEDEDDDDF